jgi:hypothetical protein
LALKFLMMRLKKSRQLMTRSASSTKRKPDTGGANPVLRVRL